jgi:hypothetical protein
MPIAFRLPRLLGVPAVLALLIAAAFTTGCDKQPAKSTTAETTPATASQPKDDVLRDRVDAVIDYSRDNRTLSTNTHNAWQIVHGILPYGRSFKIEKDGQKIGALDWLLSGGDLKGWDLTPGDHGVHAELAPGSKAAQGHPDQWIGYLSQGGEDGRNGLPPTTKIVVRGKEYTMGDLLSQAEADIQPGQEASWTLMALAAYRPSNYEWTSKTGEKWSVERVAEMETGLPIVGDGTSCGGTHRLYGLSAALNRYLAESGKKPEELAGGWKKVNDTVNDCIKKAHDFQQPDGSFSTNFFARAGRSPEVDTTLHATGHTLEWLCIALDDKQFNEPWVTKSVVKLCQLLEDNANRELDCGALYHADRGLILYRDRKFGPRTATPSVAATPEAAQTTSTAK